MNYCNLFEHKLNFSLQSKFFAEMEYKSYLSDFWRLYKINQLDSDLKYMMMNVLAANMALQSFN